MEKKEHTNEERAMAYVFGQNSYGELGLGDSEERQLPTPINYFSHLDIVSVAAGNEHTAVLTRSGEVYTFGFNGSGQLGHSNNKSIALPKAVEALKSVKIAQLSSANGCEHLAAVSDDGCLYSCGYNNYG